MLLPLYIILSVQMINCKRQQCFGSLMANYRKRKAPISWVWDTGDLDDFGPNILGGGNKGTRYLPVDTAFPFRTTAALTLRWADGSCGHAENFCSGGQLWNLSCKCYGCATKDF